MAEDFDSGSLRRRCDERRNGLRDLRSSLSSSLDATLDYFSSVPVTEEEERLQKDGIRADLSKLDDRIRDFRARL
jgi:hypothetical protein